MISYTCWPKYSAATSSMVTGMPPEKPASDESIRLKDANAERINIPANPKHYWRYRMHLTIETLLAERDFNDQIKELVDEAGRRL